MLQKQGICPVCGSDELEYDGFELQGEQTGFPWRCLNCEAEGTEWYEMQFVAHEDIVENK